MEAIKKYTKIIKHNTTYLKIMEKHLVDSQLDVPSITDSITFQNWEKLEKVK